MYLFFTFLLLYIAASFWGGLEYFVCDYIHLMNLVTDNCIQVIKVVW